jgi:hypothetical protein
LQIDYEKEHEWERKVRTTWTDWRISLETIIQWSPYSTEAELIQEVYPMFYDHLMVVDVAVATILVFPMSCFLLWRIIIAMNGACGEKLL